MCYRIQGIRGKSGKDIRKTAENELGSEFVTQVDLICVNVASITIARRHWIKQNLLQDLSARLQKQFGISLCFHESLISWLLSNRCSNQRDRERLVDESIGSLLVRSFPLATNGKVKTVLLKLNKGTIEAETMQC